MCFLKLLVQFLIELSVLSIILLIAGSPLLPFLPVAILLMVLLAMFGTGFALALSTLSVYFKDMSYLFSVSDASYAASGGRVFGHFLEVDF